MTRTMDVAGSVSKAMDAAAKQFEIEKSPYRGVASGSLIPSYDKEARPVGRQKRGIKFR